MTSSWLIPCPYPGPIPLAAGQPLFGRAQAVGLLGMMVSRRHLVTITAASGVGKTSLLQAGLVPEMAAAGYTVVRFADWGNLHSREPLEQLTWAVRRALEEPPSDEAPEDVIARWRWTYGDGLVVIFDQFEELFRQDRDLGLNFLRAIRDQIVDAYPPAFRFVLSLRSEFRDEVSVLETELDPQDYESFRLDEIDVDAVEQLVTDTPALVLKGWAREHQLPQPLVRIDPAAVRFVVDGWHAARASERDASTALDSSVGLLHLQALLVRLWQDVRPTPGSTFGMDAIQAVGLHRDFSTSADVARAEFARALEVYADRQILELGRTEPDARKARETRDLLAVIAPLLSSGNYKLIRDTPELAAAAFPEGIAALGLTDQIVEDTVAWAERRLSDSYDAAAVERIEEWLSARVDQIGRPLELGVPPELSRNLASGRLFGASPARVLAELVVTFHRAIAWLEHARIVRTSPTRRRTRMVALIHDGFGPALTTWARRVAEEPEAAFAGLVAFEGASLFQQYLPDGSQRHVAVKVVGEHSHLLWPGCVIEGDLTDITFVECDLRGALFLGAGLERVVFRDCILWGTLFTGCTLTGVRVESTPDGGFGVRDGLAQGGGDRLDEVRSLTFSEGCTFTGPGLTLDGLSGYGVFVRGSGPGDLTIRGCRALEHVGIISGPEGAATRITESRLRHLDYVGSAASSLVVVDSVLDMASLSPSEGEGSVGEVSLIGTRTRSASAVPWPEPSAVQGGVS